MVDKVRCGEGINDCFDGIWLTLFLTDLGINQEQFLQFLQTAGGLGYDIDDYTACEVGFL